MWFRWDCAAADNELWNELGDRLGVPSAQALGHYLLMTSRLVRRRHDGNLAEVPSSALESWAGWSGEPGLWAAAIRSLCQDENGELRGFRRRNEKLISRQVLDRLKRRPQKNPPETPEGFVRKPPENPLETLGLTKTMTVDGNSSSSSSSSAEADAIRYTQVCTGAANKGLSEGLGPGFHELVSANQTDVVAEWLRDGIPVEVAAQAIYERAQHYKPSATRKQPTGLRYFRQVVQEAWDRERSRSAPLPAAKPDQPQPHPASHEKYRPPRREQGGDPQRFGEILAAAKAKFGSPQGAT